MYYSICLTVWKVGVRLLFHTYSLCHPWTTTNITQEIPFPWLLFILLNQTNTCIHNHTSSISHLAIESSSSVPAYSSLVPSGYFNISFSCGLFLPRNSSSYLHLAGVSVWWPILATKYYVSATYESAVYCPSRHTDSQFPLVTGGCGPYLFWPWAQAAHFLALRHPGWHRLQSAALADSAFFSPGKAESQYIISMSNEPSSQVSMVSHLSLSPSLQLIIRRPRLNIHSLSYSNS
jgi:hypothetical protein